MQEAKMLGPNGVMLVDLPVVLCMRRRTSLGVMFAGVYTSVLGDKSECVLQDVRSYSRNRTPVISGYPGI